jgi:predicted amidohydrolase
MRIGLITATPSVSKKEENLKKIEGWVKQANADLLIFGELFLSGYGKAERSKELAEEMEGSSLGFISQLAKEYNKYLVIGCPLKVKEQIYNSALIFYPSGERGIYHKSYLPNFGPFKEKAYFAQGREIKLFDLGIGKVSLSICYDAFFPELWKLAALKGAELIICISASPFQTRYYFETVLPARALENTVFIAYVNLVGKQDNMLFWGGSQAYGPWGNLLVKAPYFKERIDYADLNFEEIKVARSDRPTLKDTSKWPFEKLAKLLKSQQKSFKRSLIA